MFKKDNRNWVEYRQLPDLMEVDFHWEGQEPRRSYDEKMDEVLEKALNALKKAQIEGKKHVLFTHGSSTSRPGATTSRSQVRRLMRSKVATPYILRSQSIQHDTVFVATIRQKQSSYTSRGQD